MHPQGLKASQEITFATCLDLLAPSFVVRSLQIAADMRLAHVSLGDKISAASCDSYFLRGPYCCGRISGMESTTPSF